MQLKPSQSVVLFKAQEATPSASEDAYGHEEDVWGMPSDFPQTLTLTLTSRESLYTFAAYIKKQACVAKYIRHLVIRDKEGNRSVSTKWLSEALLSLPSLLSHLQTIELVDVVDDGKLKRCDLRGFKLVTSLILRNCAIPPRPAMSCAAMLPNLEHLIVSNMRDVPDLTPEDAPSFDGLRLKSLSIPPSNISFIIWPLLDPVRISPSVTSLRRLSIVASKEVIGQLSAFLHDSGGALEELELIPCIRGGLKSLCMIEPASFQRCVSLRTLQLWGLQTAVDNPACIDVSFLTNISSPHIRHINLHYWLNRPVVNFDYLADAFAGHNLRHLKKVEFIYEGPHELSMMADKLIEGLPAVYRRRILRLSRLPTNASTWQAARESYWIILWTRVHLFLAALITCTSIVLLARYINLHPPSTHLLSSW